jgi:hypothetical protein
MKEAALHFHLFFNIGFLGDSLKISTPVRSPWLSRQLELLPKFNLESAQKAARFLK